MNPLKGREWITYIGLVGMVLFVVFLTYQSDGNGIRKVSASTDNFYEINLLEEWQSIKNELDLPDELLLISFQCDIKVNGTIQYISYVVRGQVENDKIMQYWINDISSSEGIIYTVKSVEVSSLNEGLHYFPALTVEDVFTLMDGLDFTQVSPVGDFTEYSIHVWGSKDTVYEYEDGLYLIKDKEINQIEENILPFEGYLLTVQGLKFGSIAVELGVNAYNYYFDAYKLSD